jgi:hypothetical protein
VVVKDLFPAAALIRANSVLEVASQLSLVAGPTTVGVLAAVGSIRLALLADALTFVASLLSLFAVGRWRPGARARLAGRSWRGMSAELREGLRYVMSVRVLVILIAVQMVVNFAYTWALVVASLVNRTQRQRIVPRAMLGRVTSGVRALFLAVDPLGVVIAGTAMSALGGDPRPVFLAAGAAVVTAAAAGWLAGLRRAGP